MRSSFFSKAVLATASLISLAGCSTHTKGSWACGVDRGVPCAAIDTLDHMPAGAGSAHAEAHPATVDGAGALRWWAKNDALSGNFDKAPRREPDQFVRVMIAGWVDGAGDYHAPSEIYAVMRRGGWWAAPPASPLVNASVASAGVTAGSVAPTPISAPPSPQSPQSGPASVATGDDGVEFTLLPPPAAMRTAPKAGADPVAAVTAPAGGQGHQVTAPAQPGKL